MALPQHGLRPPRAARPFLLVGLDEPGVAGGAASKLRAVVSKGSGVVGNSLQLLSQGFGCCRQVSISAAWPARLTWFQTVPAASVPRRPAGKLHWESQENTDERRYRPADRTGARRS